MKKTLSYIAPLALAAAFCACDNEFERPPMVVPVSSWKANTTIEEFKAEYWNTVESSPVTVGLTADGDSVIVKGRVCSSDKSGNIFKYLMIQGETEAIALSLDFYDIYLTYKYGQEVYVNLTGLTVGGYSGLMCVGSGSDDRGRVARAPEALFASHSQTDGLPSASKVDTFLTTISEVDLAKSSAEGLQTWQSRLVRFDNVRFENAGEPFAVGTSSNSRYIVDSDGNRMNVYNSTYADFKDELLPSGSGSVVGILSYFGTNWQVLLNDADGCLNFDGVSAPQFSPAPGIVKPGTAVSITCATEGAKIYYTLDGSVPDGSSTLYTEPIVLTESTHFRAIALKDGLRPSAIADARFTVSETAPTTGDGTENSPYTVTQVITLNPTSTQEALEKTVWVNGYIVGYIPVGGTSTTIAGMVFGTSGTVAASNLVIAESPDVTDYKECIAVQLTSGTAFRAALNLLDHPDNIGKHVEVQGDLMKYCGAPGVKNLIAAKLEGEKIGVVDPVTPPENTKTVFSETFTNGNLDGFSILTACDGGDWSGWRANTSSPQCAIANSYVNGKNLSASSYLISPSINLGGAKSAYIKLEHAYGFYFPTIQEHYCVVQIREVGETEWTKLTLTNFPPKRETGNWTDFAESTIDISQYADKSIEISFFYINDGKQSIAWEIRNFSVLTTY